MHSPVISGWVDWVGYLGALVQIEHLMALISIQNIYKEQRKANRKVVNSLIFSQAADWIDHTSLILQICSYQAKANQQNLGNTKYQ